MKNRLKMTKEQTANVLFGVVLQIYLLYPWIHTNVGNYNVCTYLLGALRKGSFTDFFNECFPKGIELMPESALSVLIGISGLLFLFMFIEQVLIFCSIICSFFRIAPRILSTISSLMTVIMCIVWSSNVLDGGRLEGVNNVDIVSRFTFIYPFIMIFITGIWFIAIRTMGEWDEAAKRAHEERRAKKEYRKERKRRLKFPGHYCRLYYRVLWKNLWNNRKDYIFLLLAGTLSVLFLFLGISLWFMLRGSEGGQNDYIMLSLSGVMREFGVIITIITFLLLMLVITFYRKKRLAGNGLFDILGMRSNMLFISWMTEMIAAFLFSLVFGLGVGTILLGLFRQICQKVFPELGYLYMPGITAYGLTVVIMLVISLFAYGCAHDLHAMQKSADGRAAAVR